MTQKSLLGYFSSSYSAQSSETSLLTPLNPLTIFSRAQLLCHISIILLATPLLETEVHPLPKPEEIFASSAGGQKFTKLDLANAYQRMVLNKESREVLTINTHKGLYSYTRLPFGVSSAPAIFQRTMDTILAGTLHIACYIDNIIVTGTDVADHLRNLESVLDSLQKHGIKAKESKCTLWVSQYST